MLYVSTDFLLLLLKLDPLSNSFFDVKVMIWATCEVFHIYLALFIEFSQFI